MLNTSEGNVGITRQSKISTDMLSEETEDPTTLDLSIITLDISPLNAWSM
jgi:hypothetical protein